MKKSLLVLLSLKLLILLTWCISTCSKVPHTIQALNKLDLVNLLFQFCSRLLYGSRSLPVRLITLCRLKCSGANKDTLLTSPFWLVMSQPRSFPNLAKVPLIVFSLNFLARVRQQDSVSNQQIKASCDMLLTKL